MAHLDVTSYSDPRDTIDKSAVNDLNLGGSI